jgi:hypothetical protein
MRKKMPGFSISGAYTAFLIIFIVLMTAWLGRTTCYINAWPSDSAASYIPTAAKLFEMRFFSQMHDLHLHGLSRLNMRGKEALIVDIAILQRILGDTKSLYPNILLLILSCGLSSGLLFLIFKKFFNATAGFVAFVLFAFSFWPYMYVLLGAHQPLVLCNFLLSFFFLQRAGPRRVYLFLGGLFFGLTFFSSPPYYVYAVLRAAVVGGSSGFPALPRVFQENRPGVFVLFRRPGRGPTGLYAAAAFREPENVYYLCFFKPRRQPFSVLRGLLEPIFCGTRFFAGRRMALDF